MGTGYKQRRSNEWIVVEGRYDGVEFVECVLELPRGGSGVATNCRFVACDFVGAWPEPFASQARGWPARHNPLHEPEVMGMPVLPVSPIPRPRKWWRW